jgi:hypothetical protein
MTTFLQDPCVKSIGCWFLAGVITYFNVMILDRASDEKISDHGRVLVTRVTGTKHE